MPAPSPRSGVRIKIGVGLLLGLHAGLLLWGAFGQSLTVDEPVHLASGLRRLEDGRFDINRGNPPLVGTFAALPVLLAHPRVDWHSAPDSHVVRADFVTANGSRAFRLITLGRLACIPFSLLAGFVCFRWACEVYGATSGFVALTLWCFSPNALAHGSLISGDMAATALGVAAFYAYWKWLQSPSLARSLVAGVALGLAEAAKYVWVLLYFVWPLLWIVWRLLRGAMRPCRSWLKESGLGLLIAALSILILNLSYLFQNSFQPLDRFHIGKILIESMPASGGIRAAVAAVPVPLPEDYIGGLDEIQQFREARPWSYLCGEFRSGGWWYFYLYALAVKVPLGSLGLLGMASIIFLAGNRTSTWRVDLFFAVIIAAILSFVTFSNTVQTFRYILPVLPFMILLASEVGRVFQEDDRLVAALVGACPGWSILSSLWIYPHSLSYFNEIVGGPMEGHECLAETNIDWGQDLFYLKEWLAKHPEAEPFHLAYFGRVDPQVIGIEYSLPTSLDKSAMAANEWGSLLGWNAVSVNLLDGFRWAVPDGQGGVRQMTGTEYRGLLRLAPAAMAGYSIRIYHVTPDDLNQIRALREKR